MLVRVAAWAGAVTDDGDRGRGRPVASVGRVQVDRDVAGVRAGPAGAGRGDERDAGGQGVGDRQAGRVGRAVVDDHQGVGDAPPGDDGGRAGLGDRQVGRRGDRRGRGRAGVVGRRSGRRSCCRRRRGVGQASPPGAARSRSTVMAGAVVPVARAGRVQVTETLPAFVQVQPVPVAETKVDPGGQGVGHRQVRRVGRAVVGDAERVGDASRRPSPSAGPVLVIARSADAVTVVRRRRGVVGRVRVGRRRRDRWRCWSAWPPARAR